MPYKDIQKKALIEYQGGIPGTKGNFFHRPDATTLRLNEGIMPQGGIRQIVKQNEVDKLFVGLPQASVSIQ